MPGRCRRSRSTDCTTLIDGGRPFSDSNVNCTQKTKRWRWSQRASSCARLFTYAFAIRSHCVVHGDERAGSTEDNGAQITSANDSANEGADDSAYPMPALQWMMSGGAETLAATDDVDELSDFGSTR